jgi:hypothetical protein
MDLMELVKYIGQDGNHLLGTVIVLGVIFSGIAKIIRAFHPTPEQLKTRTK